MSHVNTNLPPVNTKIFIKHNGEWLRVVRDTWSRRWSDPIKVRVIENDEEITIPRFQIEWKY